MGLFDTFKTVSEFSPQEAYFGMVFGVLASDGDVDDGETSALMHALVYTKLFDGLSEDDVNKVFRRVNLAAEKNGLEFLFTEANRVLSPDLKKAAFVTAVDLAFADGNVGEAEEAFLEESTRCWRFQRNLSPKSWKSSKFGTAHN
jgi:tellurite resistance protein